ncbi:MAG: hypothetical protein ACJAVK_001036 [Akkermansiaceae bacterium]|jgi:hypothetical protein
MNPEDAREIALPQTGHPLPSEIALQKIDSELDAIIIHAISPKREERYRSVRELMADLRRHLNGDELAIQTTQQKSRSVPILIGIAILAIYLTAAWFIQAQSSDEPQTAEESEVAQSDYQGFEFDSPEDKALAKLLISLREPAMGPELANQRENTAWSDLPKGNGSQQLRLLKNLLGSIWFFQNQREELKWAKDDRD